MYGITRDNSPNPKPFGGPGHGPDESEGEAERERNDPRQWLLEGQQTLMHWLKK